MAKDDYEDDYDSEGAGFSDAEFDDPDKDEDDDLDDLDDEQDDEDD